MFEKIYFIYNPLNNLQDWIAERELKMGSEKLKNVFGVLYLRDLTIMLQYNIPFKDSIMKKFILQSDNNISLSHVCRLINKIELDEFLMKEVNDAGWNVKSIHSTYPASIEIKDGYYDWDAEKSCYVEATKILKA
ncbi:hypothetical protein [Pseudoneobacillus sp. C159]